MSPAPVPERIGPFRVTGHLGRGGMGEVVRGYDDRLNRPVALKRVLAESRNPEKALERFRREAQAVAKLSHPAIVQVFDWVESEGQHWLVMELVAGRPLSRLLDDGPLTPARAIAIAREVASGLAAAHDVGIVHRDLKASNVMVTTPDAEAKERVKILDFGLAKPIAGPELAATALTEEGYLVGTLTSMSPEQALGEPVDHRADLFSLGVLIFEMVSGVSPFSGRTVAETLTRLCTAKEKPLSELVPEVPAGLARLVAQLLEKDPARRPPSARQVVAELDRLGSARLSGDSGSPPWATGPETKEVTLVAFAAPPRERSGGRRRLPIAAAVAIALGLGGLIGWLWQRSELWRSEPEPAVDLPPAAAGGPEAELTSNDLYRRGLGLLERPERKGNVEQAIADFQRAVARDEGSAPALAGLARAYWMDFYRGSRDPQRLKQALAAAEQAVRLNEHLAMSRVVLGQVYLELGRFEEAVKELERALQIEPSNADARFVLGKVAAARGNVPEAEEHFRRASVARPDDSLPHTELGVLYYQSGRYEEAAAAFSRAVALRPDSFVAHSNLGAIYYMQGRLAEAATELQRALEIKPDSGVYSNVGTIYFTQGLYAQAVSAFEKAIESGGANDYVQWGNLGDALRWTPDNERRARETYLRAIQLLRERLAAKPQDATLRTRLVLYLAKRGDCDQARAEAAAIGAPGAGDGGAWFRVAVAQEVCGHRDAALAALRGALEAKFSSEEVRLDPELLDLRRDVRYHRLVMQHAPSGDG